MKKGRILHLRSSGGIYGAENVILEIGKRSAQNGWESIIGAIKNRDDPYPHFLDIAKAHNLPTAVFECKSRLDLKCLQNIKNYINYCSVDILHSHGYKENLYSLLLKSPIPKLTTNHLWKKFSIKSKFYCFIDSLIIKYFDAVIGVSNEIVFEMNKFGVKKSFQITNGVDINHFAPHAKSRELVEKYGLSHDEIIFGMVSSLTYEKNHKIVIPALKKLKNKRIKLLIVGEGKLKDSIRTQVYDAGIENQVVFTGIQANIVEHLSVIDIFLLPSLSEGLPMALLEAMSCGKAVIASRVGEIPNVIQNRMNGCLIDPGNHDQLLGAMRYLIDNETHRQNFGEAARKVVEKFYSSEIMTERYCRLYDSLRLN